MPQISPALAGILAAEAAASVLFAILLGRFVRNLSAPYLREWCYSWYALAVYSLLHLGELYLLGSDRSEALRGLIATSAVIAGSLQLAWVVSGSLEVAYRRPMKVRSVNALLALVTIIGIAAAIAEKEIASDPARNYVGTIAMRALFLAIGGLVAATSVWRHRARGDTLGFDIFSLSLALYAAAQMLYLSLALVWLSGDSASTYAVYLAVLDFLSLMFLGLGMVIAVLEDAREAAGLAASEIEHLAYHDPLTGLPNRSLFFDRLIIGLAQAERERQNLAVYFVDLDRFKEINDSLGHSAGDQVLRSTARRIRECVRQADTVARFGGDEFTLVVHNFRGPDDLVRIARKILEQIRIPFVVGDHELSLSTSVGISIYPDDGADAESLVKNADTAMYRAKDLGRDCYQMYTPSMNSEALARLELESRLRRALTADELLMHYQPIIDLTSSTVRGFEALVRWRHPELGLLQPNEFIPTAEASGLIIPLGNWVLRAACQQAVDWKKKTGIPRVIAVNLSARQFRQGDLVSHVGQTLAAVGIDPALVELEITETSAMQNAESSIRVLRDLKALGVRISLDDFGTGYSSLSYLQNFPIDALKLDRSFVEALERGTSATIVSAVISMAHTLGVKVIAEGVETETQLEFLRNEGCDLIQGYVFSPARPPQECAPFLTARPVDLHLRRVVKRITHRHLTALEGH